MTLDLHMNLAAVVAVLTVTAGVTKLLSDWLHGRRPDPTVEPVAMIGQLTDLFREMKTDMREVRGMLRDHSEDHRSLMSQTENILGDLEAFSREMTRSRVDIAQKIAETPERVAQSLRGYGPRKA